MMYFIEKVIGLECDKRMRGNACSEAYAAWVDDIVAKWQLSGSEKQIAWARKILHSELIEIYHFHVDYSVWADAYKSMVENKDLNDSKFIIEHRYGDFFDKKIIEKAGAEVAAIEEAYSYKESDDVLLDRAKKIFESIKKN